MVLYRDLVKIDKCARCGYREMKGSLHVHHIDKDRDNNAPENLILLCANCHMGLHHGEWKLEDIINTPESYRKADKSYNKFSKRLEQLENENEQLRNENKQFTLQVKKEKALLCLLLNLDYTLYDKALFLLWHITDEQLLNIDYPLSSKSYSVIKSVMSSFSSCFSGALIKSGKINDYDLDSIGADFARGKITREECDGINVLELKIRAEALRADKLDITKYVAKDYSPWHSFPNAVKKEILLLLNPQLTTTADIWKELDAVGDMDDILKGVV